MSSIHNRSKPRSGLTKDLTKKKKNSRDNSNSQEVYTQRQYQKIVTKMQSKRLNKEILNFYTRNSMNSTVGRNRLTQQWSSKRQEEEQQEEQNQIHQNTSSIVISFVAMITFTLTIWISNVESFFKDRDSTIFRGYYYVLPLILNLIDALEKIIQLYKKGNLFKQRVIKTLPSFIVSSLYLLIKISQLDSYLQTSNLWLFFQLIALYNLYLRARKYYKCFRYMSLLFRYEYHFKAFDLIFSLIMVAHIIATFLYRVSTFNNSNWLTRLQLPQTNQLIRYIYSFYFGSTTILTVGYGDIIPTNPLQVAMICLVQIFGIATFAYLINQIGYNLSNLRKDKEIIEKDITILEKIKDFYHIDEELVSKARTYLVKNHSATNRLKPEQENSLVTKLNESLRNEIWSNSSMSIIKSSIFFLCRWSKNFQHMIVGHINNIFLSPGEYVFQPEGKERIYIIRQGKLDLYTRIKGSKKELKNVIKTIEVKPQTQVTDNSYGYTAVISRKPIEIFAVAKDFTSAYFIQKEKFLKCVDDKNYDSEYFHQIRDKIDQESIPESYEIPSIRSCQYHYNPTKYCIIKKNIVRQNNYRNIRIFSVRLTRRLRKFINISSMIQMPRHSSIMETQINQDKVREQSLSYEVRKVQDFFISTQVSSKKNIPFHITTKQNSVQDNSFQGDQTITEQNLIVFEASKQYENYFPRNNMLRVIKKYQLSQFLEMSQALRQFAKLNYDLVPRKAMRL